MAEAEERIAGALVERSGSASTRRGTTKEAATANRHRDALTELEGAHADQMTELEAAQALELATHNVYWDDVDELMALRHGVELDNLRAAHTAQREALLASLVERQ